MHRMLRCSPQILALAFLGIAVVPASPILAQNSDQPTQTQTDSGSTSTTTVTPDQQTAHTKLRDRLAVRLRLGDGVRQWRPTRRQLGISYAPGGSDASTPGTFQFTVDRMRLRHYLTLTAPYVHRLPKDAYPVVDPTYHGDFDGEVPAIIKPGRPGADLDIDAAVDQITAAVQSDPVTTHVVLPLKTKPQDVTANDLTGIDSRIGYFVTHFNPGDVGRTLTVRKAISIIDGHVLEPGAIFSVNDVVGERTAARGFGIGHVFVDGKMEKEVGGGMCQVATTLFNASMLADLKIVERFQHVRTIPYVDPGRDATVWFGTKDFKIQNDTTAPLYISYITTYSRAIVALYGKGTPGRKVVLVNHYRELGPRHFTGVFYRIVHEPDNTVHRDKPFYSDYQWTPALDYTR